MDTLFVLMEVKQDGMVVFRFAFRTSSEDVRKVQRRYSKVLEETDESEGEDKTDNSKRNTGTQLISVVF